MIKISGLTKKFGQFTAVDNISFDVSTGEAVALWGPNGAGKTTIIRALLGLLKTEGELRINGLDVKKEGKKARAVIGYVPQELAFYDELSVWNSLHFYASLKSVSAASIIPLVLEEVGLTEHANKDVASLSGGMKQRLALASALLASPLLLILDEPTSNLDSAARDDFIKLLIQQKEQGKTILFTSHRLEEVESIATRILVLEKGQVQTTCTTTELATKLGLTLKLKLFVAENMIDKAVNLLKTKGLTTSHKGGVIQINIAPSAKMIPIKILLDGDIEIKNFKIDNGY